MGKEGFHFIGHLPDAEAMQAFADELRQMPDHSQPISVGETKTIGELIQALEAGNEVGIDFLRLRRRTEETLKSLGKTEKTREVSEPQPKVPPEDLFIGDSEFGIAREAISAQVIEATRELAKINAAFASGNISEDLKKFAVGRKSDIEKFLLESGEEILRACQEIYDFVAQAEQEGLKRQNILQKMSSEKPELKDYVVKFYAILRTQVWGYRLFQDLCGFRG